MNLGAFSLSLNVSDLAKSRAFYEKLGFTVTGGDAEQNWLILRNGETTLGLFHGMFDKNMMTFNPGWKGSDMSSPDDFDDVRAIQKHFDDQGIVVTMRVQSESGPGHLMLEDPDGNPILIDQHRE